jgi:murein DD-endopeptidase MepM/ murein hydrolase activator NlpD
MMRYPVGNTGSREEFERDWYSAQAFGQHLDYSYHEGVDINLRTGGDSDLGQPLRAIADGRVLYYHYGSHPGTGFGRHLVMRIDGLWGARWVHYAHCDLADFTNRVVDVQEGQIIARLGKSGDSPLAHLHFAIFKVDPGAIGGIDKFAITLTELNNWWEDPIAFIQQWSRDCPPPVITDETVIPQIGGMQVREIREILEDQNRRLDEIRAIVG